jgi:ribosomal protein L29
MSKEQKSEARAIFDKRNEEAAEELDDLKSELFFQQTYGARFETVQK